jgi:hypothetical protein
MPFIARSIPGLYATSRRSALSGGVLEDHVGTLLADHDRGRIGVAGHDCRHDRGIDHAKPCKAVHSQPFVGHGGRVLPHSAGADGMEGGGAAAADEIEQLVVALAPVAGLDLLGYAARLGWIAGARRGSADLIRT